MDIAQRIPVAAWGMHGSGGWWIIPAAVMMVGMGVMMWMMMRGMMGGGSSQRSSAPSEGREATQRTLEILDRRMAEGEISLEDYRERREALTNGAHPGQPDAGDSEREEAAQAAGKGKP
jgi:uncharacterized membrane protein